MIDDDLRVVHAGQAIDLDRVLELFARSTGLDRALDFPVLETGVRPIERAIAVEHDRLGFAGHFPFHHVLLADVDRLCIGIIGIIGVLATMLLGSPAIFGVALVLFIGFVIILAVVAAAMQGIFVTALYTYARTGTVPSAFRSDLIQNAFIQK